MTLARLLSVLAVALWAEQGLAQGLSLDGITGQGSTEEPPPEETPPAEDAEPVPPPSIEDLTDALPVYDEWSAVAGAAEETLARGDASAFRLSQLWDEIFSWRERFEGLSEENGNRLATLNAQIAALTPPEGEAVPEIVSGRLTALEAERDRVLAPRLLAQEGLARAEGLLNEVDAQIADRDFADLTDRASTPANPALWPGALTHLGESLSSLGQDIAQAWRGLRTDAGIAARLPLSLLIVAVGVVLMVVGLRFFAHWDRRVTEDGYEANLSWRLVSDVLALVLPSLGLVLVLTGPRYLETVGPRLDDLLTAAYSAGLTAIIARWLSQRFFPAGERMGPLRYGPDNRHTLRRLSFGLGLTIAFGILWQQIVDLGDVESAEKLVLLLPVHLMAGYLLFRMGSRLKRPPDSEETASTRSGPRTRSLIGRGIMLVGLVGPVLALLGYGNATQALIVPAVQTLAVFGLVILLQRLVNDIFTRNREQDAEDAGPLAPLLIGFSFFLLALPILALIWGASGTDLLQYWARFRAGFTLGDIRISPENFLTFIVVFTIGFFLTRFLQGTLRSSVLPRTKLDLGGQNAVVSGFGYIGITLASIIAVTMAGIDLSNLAIVAGALSVGIGFGLQTVVSNFVSGIILLVERPVSEGDWIEINGQMGYVRDISVRSTRIETFDRTDVIVPNADLVSQQVINWTRGNSVGRAIVPVGVAYGSDVDRVMEILKEVAMDHPLVLHNPEPMVLFMGFGASSLDFEVRAILRDVNFVMPTKSELGVAIDRRFREEGIEIPFPQRDVWVRGVPGSDKTSDAEAQTKPAETAEAGPLADQTEPPLAGPDEGDGADAGEGPAT